MRNAFHLHTAAGVMGFGARTPEWAASSSQEGTSCIHLLPNCTREWHWEACGECGPSETATELWSDEGPQCIPAGRRYYPVCQRGWADGRRSRAKEVVTGAFLGAPDKRKRRVESRASSFIWAFTAGMLCSGSGTSHNCT
jgi:hypothetical protein